MAGFYSDMAAVATDLLHEFNQGAVTLTKTTPGTPDPSTKWLPGTPTETVYTLDAVVSGMSGANAKYIDGTVITAADLVVTHAVISGAEPAMGDKLTIDGKGRVIKKIVRIPESGTAVAFKIFVAG